VADVFGQSTVNASQVRYIVEGTATNSAAGVAEGGTKPESTLGLLSRTDRLGEWRHRPPVRLASQFSRVHPWEGAAAGAFAHLRARNPPPLARCGKDRMPERSDDERGGTSRPRAVCLPEREPWEPTLTSLRPMPKPHYPGAVRLCGQRSQSGGSRPPRVFCPPGRSRQAHSTLFRGWCADAIPSAIIGYADDA
jgi:hypothetical protein